MIYTTNQDPHNDLYNYLCFIKARLDPKYKNIYEQ